MQVTVTPPAPPAPPVVGALAGQTPTNRAELDALRMLRSELADQRNAITQQRSQLMAERMMVPDQARGALDARFRALDERSAAIDRQVEAADQAIAGALARGVGVPNQGMRVFTSQAPRAPGFNREIAGMLIAEAVILIIVGAVLFRWLLGRARAPQAGAGADQGRRMEQLQQSVDVMALEIERISEGQRYVTRLLNESLQPAIARGAAGVVPAPDKAAQPVRRDPPSGT